MTANTASILPQTDTSHNDMANVIRALSMDAVQTAKSGHPGMPMGMADVATILWGEFLKHNPDSPHWPDRDRFVLSAGHGSMLLYSLLYLTGYPDMTLDEIKNFRKLGSRTAGHPEYGHASGIETTTGPLGQGIANAVGMALAEQMMEARFGSDLVNHYTYCIAGDGCLMEGISHEAISMAGHLGLSKLIILFDDNGITIDGKTDLTVSDDHCKRFEACGWDAVKIDGHDPIEISEAIQHARTTNKPSLIACKTTIGYGSPNKGGTSSCHGAPLGNDEIIAAKKSLGWKYDAFEVPENILQKWRNSNASGKASYEAWQERFENFAKSDPDKADMFIQMMTGDLPDDWNNNIESYKKELATSKPKEASRVSSQKALELLTDSIPYLAGGSADLTGSNNTKSKSQQAISKDNFSGNYIYYGVREHAMSAAMNGIALHGGFIPYAGTFLVFSDYCRNAIRLSALMKQRVIYVMTHDSIGLGEDGPTHQPVEHLASLRAIPQLNVFRPADATETLESWAIAVSTNDAPSLFALSRQGLPALRNEYTPDNLTAKGAYILREAEGGEKNIKSILLASGSETQLAIEARDILQSKGIPTRVVSVPCFELFDKQPESYRNEVLGNNDILKIAIEAGIRMGWDKYLGTNGHFIGMDSFGASAPAPELYKHFGITTDAIVNMVTKYI